MDNVQSNTFGKDFSDISRQCVFYTVSRRLSATTTFLYFSAAGNTGRTDKGEDCRRHAASHWCLNQSLQLNLWQAEPENYAQSLERESTPTPSHCTAVNKETEVWDVLYVVHRGRDTALEEYRHPKMPLAEVSGFSINGKRIISINDIYYFYSISQKKLHNARQWTYCTAEPALKCKIMHTVIKEYPNRE